MSFYRNKRKNEDDFIDDGDDEEDEESSEEEKSTRKKKVASKKSRKEEKGGGKIDPKAGITVCEISKNRKVVVKLFKSLVLVDIREYWSKDGEMLPSKKGISLSLDQWKVLAESMDKVDAAIQEMS